MSLFFMIIGGLFALATLGTLLVGVTAMGKGGAFNDKYGNKLMRFRIIFQGCAVGFFVLGLLTR
jgi:hypothetical protein